MKILLCGISEIFLPMFSWRTFMVSWLIFKSFIHLEFIFVYRVSWWSSLIFLHVAVQISNTICWRGYFCSILCCCPLCRLIDCRDLGLFLGSLFCSIGLCACAYASTRLFDYSGLVIQFDIRYCDPSCFVLLSQNCCSYSGSFMVPYKFLKCWFYICEICHWYLNRYCIESLNFFG